MGKQIKIDHHGANYGLNDTMIVSTGVPARHLVTLTACNDLADLTQEARKPRDALDQLARLMPDLREALWGARGLPGL